MFRDSNDSVWEDQWQWSEKKLDGCSKADLQIQLCKVSQLASWDCLKDAGDVDGQL